MGQLRTRAVKKDFGILLFAIALLTNISSCRSQERIVYSDLDEALNSKEEVFVLKLKNDSEYETFPVEIYELNNLEILSFTGSQCDMRNKGCVNINELPDGIIELSNLKELYLVMNNIHHLTDEINFLDNLRILDLSDNTSIELDNLNNENIEVLNLNGCYLNELPKNLFQMKNLKTLGLEGNNIDRTEIEMLKKTLPECEVFF